MPRRRMIRAPDEEVEFQRLRHERNAEFQRQRRAASTSVTAENNNAVVHGYTAQITLFVQSLDAIERQRRCRARRQQYPDIDTCVLNHVVEAEENYIGLMSDACTHCHAKHFAAEKIINKGNSSNDCCSHGAVCLESMPIPSNELVSLFNGTHAKSANFFKNIRSYNSSFALASFNTNLVNFNQRRPGPHFFKIQGHIYYQVNTTLCPVPGESPSYGQLFIIDANEAVDCRLNQNSNLDREMILIIDSFMRGSNLFAKSYRMMGEELRLQQERALESGECLPNLQLLFALKPGMDRRRFNFQRVNEVAAVFSTTADSEIPESYVTVRNKMTKELQTVSSMDPNVEPWIYPLFHPFETRGWHRNLTMSNKEKSISRAAYVKYRIAIRNDSLKSIRLGRRLFQQWIEDSFVKIGEDRIEFLEADQKQLRTETYHGLIDHLQNAANHGNARIGKMVILPSTFVGSPRNMEQHYQDAMGIVRKFEKPNLFLTMTCNPNS